MKWFTVLEQLNGRDFSTLVCIVGTISELSCYLVHLNKLFSKPAPEGPTRLLLKRTVPGSHRKTALSEKVVTAQEITLHMR